MTRTVARPMGTPAARARRRRPRTGGCPRTRSRRWRGRGRPLNSSSQGPRTLVHRADQDVQAGATPVPAATETAARISWHVLQRVRLGHPAAVRIVAQPEQPLHGVARKSFRTLFGTIAPDGASSPLRPPAQMACRRGGRTARGRAPPSAGTSARLQWPVPRDADLVSGVVRTLRGASGRSPRTGRKREFAGRRGRG